MVFVCFFFFFLPQGTQLLQNHLLKECLLLLFYIHKWGNEGWSGEGERKSERQID